MNDSTAFPGKVAFITGAALGFGAAFAQALCERGAKVALVDTNAKVLASVAADLRENGHEAIAITCDVSDEAAVQTAVARTASEMGGIDILINNAGLHSLKYNESFKKLGIAEVRRLFDVNIMGVVNCSMACQPFMVARGGGVIINISSIAAYANTSAYGVSKLAVRGLTIAHASEFAPDNIRVNAIAPGLMATQTIRSEIPQKIFDDFSTQLQLVHRVGQVEDIVSAMLFLASDQASFITGETLKVSGGYPLHI